MIQQLRSSRKYESFSLHSSRIRPVLYHCYGQWEDVKITPLPIVFSKAFEPKIGNLYLPFFSVITIIKMTLAIFKKNSPAIHTPALLKAFGTCIHPRPKPSHSLYPLFQNTRNLAVKSISALLRGLIMVFIQCYSKQPLGDLCPVF